jgi:DNA end-binding protein Ku
MPSIVWKGHLTFGLVSIPVKLYRAARRERVKTHFVHRHEEPAPEVSPLFRYRGNEPNEPERQPPHRDIEDAEQATPPPVSRVRQALVTREDEQPVSRAEVLRGYEIEPSQYVVLERDELKSLQRRTSTNMEIVRSVRLAEIDPVFFETSYYVVPDRGGEKSYALLFASLKDTQRVALAGVGMYGREHVVIVRPDQHGMLAHTMFYTDEIRFESEFRADVNGLSSKERELAATFLEAIEAPFSPEEFKDEYREQLEALIAKKRAATGAAPVVASDVPPAPLVDILEALKQSIAIARKPPAQETRPTRKTAGSVAEAKRTKSLKAG